MPPKGPLGALPAPRSPSLLTRVLSPLLHAIRVLIRTIGKPLLFVARPFGVAEQPRRKAFLMRTVLVRPNAVVPARFTNRERSLEWDDLANSVRVRDRTQRRIQ
jgi:hypothetical protein